MALEPFSIQKTIATNGFYFLAFSAVGAVGGAMIMGVLYSAGIGSHWSPAVVSACFPIWGVFYGAITAFLATLIVFALESVNYFNNRELQGRPTAIFRPNEFPFDSLSKTDL